MTADKVAEVARRYRETYFYGYISERCDPNKSPGRYLIPEKNLSFLARDKHLAFMCDQIVEFCTEGRVEKAMRWLGFVQGVLWSDGALLADLKQDNRPNE